MIYGNKIIKKLKEKKGVSKEVIWDIILGAIVVILILVIVIPNIEKDKTIGDKMRRNKIELEEKIDIGE